MKIININLIGEFDQSPEYNKAVIKDDNLNARTKIFIMVFLFGISITFMCGFGLWFITKNINNDYKLELKKLKSEHSKLKIKEEELSAYRKNLLTELKTAKFKMLIKEQINKTFVPWSLVLEDTASKTPKNIVLLNINKTASPGIRSFGNELSISGILPNNSSRKPNSMSDIALLILNINEDSDSPLSNAEIKYLEYKNDANSYEFEIKTNVEFLENNKD